MNINYFKKYLIDNTNLPSSSIKKYVSAISTISGQMMEEEVIPMTIYSMTIEEFKEAKSRIVVRSSYVIANIAGNNMYSCALKHYENFLDNQEQHVKPSYYVEDRLYSALFNECKNNPYGTTILELSEDVNSDEDVIKEILDNAEWAKEEYHKYHFVNNYDGLIKKYDFSSITSLAYTKPVSFNYYNEVICNVSTWKEVYCKFIKAFVEDYSIIVEKISNGDFGEMILPIVSNNSNGIVNEPIEINGGFVAETNGSATEIIHHIRNLMNLAKIDYENIEIKYKVIPLIEAGPDKNLQESLDKTLEFLRTRYNVRLSYNHFIDDSEYNTDLLYKVRNSVKDIMWVYCICSKNTRYISLEFEPEYLNNQDRNYKGFTKIHNRKTHPCKKMCFESFDLIETDLKWICNNIDNYFVGGSKVSNSVSSNHKEKNQSNRKYEPYSNDTGITIKEAITKVLSESSRELTVEEIYEEIIKKDLYHFGAKDPINVVSVEVHRSCRGIENWAHAYEEKLFYCKIENNAEIKRFGLISKKHDTEKNAFLVDEVLSSDKQLKKTSPLLYDRLYSLSRRYESNIRLNIENITRATGNVASQNVVAELLDKVSWATRVSEGVYIFDDVLEKRDSYDTIIFDDFSNEIYSILNDKFQFGFSIDSPIDLLRMKNYYEQIYKKECLGSDNDLIEIIINVGYVFNKKVYAISAETFNKIEDELLDFVKNNAHIIYYSEYYLLNEEWLNKYSIYDEFLLINILKIVFPKFIFKNNYFLANYFNPINEKDAITNEIKQFWGLDCLQNYNQLCEKIQYIPLEKIKQTLTGNASNFIWNSEETYCLTNSFVIYDDEINEIVANATSLCVTMGTASLKEVIPNSVYLNNDKLSEAAIFSLVYSKISDNFDKTSHVISIKGEGHSFEDAIREYCLDRANCTFSELEEIMKLKTGTVRYPELLTVANEVMIRVDADNFVDDSKVEFDVDIIDSVLNQIVGEEFTPVKSIIAFSNFPFCGCSWNQFLLESYCRRFSKKYTFTCITPNSKNVGVIINKENLMDYHEIIIKAVAYSEVNLIESEIFDFLIEKGYMVKRLYSMIDDVISEAKKIREGR